MSNDISDVFNNIKSMIGNVDNFDSSKISPEMISNLSSLLNSNENNTTQNNTTENDASINNSSQSNLNNSNNNQSEPSIDIETILKMKTIIESMNQKNDPRANLLYSLKPYLRESRKNKLDQYVNLLKMTKIADIMKDEKKENNSNA